MKFSKVIMPNRRLLMLIGFIITIVFTIFLVWREGGLIIVFGGLYRENLIEGITLVYASFLFCWNLICLVSLLGLDIKQQKNI